MNKVYIIGMGPGTIEYVLSVAKRAIKKADCLIGAGRLLSLFKYPDQKKIRLEGRFKEVVSYVKKNKNKERIAILISGDPGLFSLLGLIKKAFKKDEYAVIPGISALQIAFARIGETWQDVKIVSIHGKSLNNLAKEVKNSVKVFLFTDLKLSPQKAAAYLLAHGIENRKAIVFENLAYLDERIVETDLKDLTKMRGFGLCVMLIKK